MLHLQGQGELMVYIAEPSKLLTFHSDNRTKQRTTALYRKVKYAKGRQMEGKCVLKGTVQRKLRWVKSSTNRQISVQCLAAGYFVENFFQIKRVTSPLNLKGTISGSVLKQGLSIDTIFYPPQFSLDSTFKGTVARDFWPLVFFMNRPPMGP